MKKFFKFFGIIVAAVVITVALGLSFIQFQYPKVGDVREVEIKPTAAALKRGEYLATNVAVCIDCHSTRDWRYFAGPIMPGTEGKGGEAFTEEYGFPGKFYSKNITPAGISSWTDGEVFHAITTGVNKKGEPFFPVMPYPNYGTMDEEDVKSIIAYIRTLKPIENKVPSSSPNFPFNFILRTIPQPATLKKRPDTSDVLLHGKYLFIVAGCNECHTQKVKGEPVPGKTLAGGFEFKFPTGAVVRSANITPDKETGIGKWTKEQFIQRFKYYNKPEAQKIPIPEGGFNTFMPWIMYSGMTEADLGAIFTYLQSVEPINNKVEIFTASTK